MHNIVIVCNHQFISLQFGTSFKLMNKEKYHSTVLQCFIIVSKQFWGKGVKKDEKMPMICCLYVIYSFSYSDMFHWVRTWHMNYVFF